MGVVMRTVVALLFALLSTALTNIAYVREHEAAAAMPELSIKRPRQSLSLLMNDRAWMLGFGLESCGFLLYAAALALAPLALVQSVAAGGIGLLAFLSLRIAGKPMGARALSGVCFSIFGLLALSLSLINGHSEGHNGSIVLVLTWLGGTALAAVLVLGVGRRRLGPAVANAIAGGLFFSIGDISTKLVTEWGARSAFVVTVVLGYALGTTMLQIGYQAGGPLTVAGLATLCTNVLPIAAGTVVLEEAVPSGASGFARVIAFVAVTIGAVLLVRPITDGGRAQGGRRALSPTEERS